VGRGEGERLDVPVFDATALLPGHELAGPALVDGPDTTVWVPPGTCARMDEVGTLTLEMARCAP